MTFRQAGIDEQISLVASLLDSMQKDPMARWLFPEDDAYLQYLGQIFQLMASRLCPEGLVYTSEQHEAVAVWITDEMSSLTEQKLSVFEQCLPETRFRQLIDFNQLVSETTSSLDNCRYLNFFGTRYADQGKGFGKALLNYSIEQLNQTDATAVTLSNGERGRQFFKSSGFNVSRVINWNNYPETDLMIRLPQ